MEVGVNFFPDVRPEEKAADVYFDECLRLVALSDQLGFHHVRIVEHYFDRYGGYSPNPITFLSAASQRSSRIKLITGAVLPAFNHPLKLAGEIGMLDAISKGRLEVGFARAFLPHEFARFGVALDESRARFQEGIEVVRELLEREQVSHKGRFHSFPPTTSLPRPTQKPRPPFWIAALATEESFVYAGQQGHSIMAIPLLGAKMRPLIHTYREAWRAAGHPGSGRVMLAYHMFCAEDGHRARTLARDPVNHYLRSLVEAASGWIEGTSSNDYPGYGKLIAALEKETFDTVLDAGGAWVGTPDEIVAQARAYQEQVGGFEVASLQVNFATLPFADAERSLGLFGREVLPRLVDVKVQTYN
jgi:alkanesulfonate monooxygenase SsuD/methylene tetrahydromethanopterin reductase-like flavin-dependent oxidoreductase (luciferase family)